MTVTNTEHRSFPLPDTAYYDISVDPNQKSKALGQFKLINRFVMPLYRSRILALIGMHVWGRMYVMTTIGRKSGKRRRVPLEYMKRFGQLYGGVSHPTRSQWYKNILVNPDQVWVQLGFRSFKAKIEFIDDDDEFFEMIKWYCTKYPRAVKLVWGFDRKVDDVEHSDFSRMKNVYKFFKIHKE